MEILCVPTLPRVTVDIKLRSTSWAGMACHARREFSVPNCNIFWVLSISKCNPGETTWQDYYFLIISIQWYRTDECKRRRKRRVIVYGSVTRYGPRTSCQREGLTAKLIVAPFGKENEREKKGRNYLVKFRIHPCQIRRMAWLERCETALTYGRETREYQ